MARETGGQAMVELALVLPVAMLTLFVLFHALVQARDLVTLHTAASHVTYDEATGRSGQRCWTLEMATHFIRSLRWGIPRPTASIVRRQIRHWRAYEFPAISPTNQPAELVSTELTYVLRTPPIFGEWLPWHRLHARYDLPFEVGIPREE